MPSQVVAAYSHVTVGKGVTTAFPRRLSCSSLGAIGSTIHVLRAGLIQTCFETSPKLPTRAQ